MVVEAGSGYCGKSSKHLTKFRAATWNVGTLKSRSVEVVETLSRRRVDLCGVQEHRWAGSLAANQTRLIKGKDFTFKFFWCGKKRGQGGAGFLLAEKWVDKVFDVLRISDRIILIRLVIGKVVFTFLSVYAPQAGLQEAEKDQFYDQLQSVMARIPASEVLIPLGDWNGHVGADSNGFKEVHHGKVFSVWNVEGERLLEFALANVLVVGNTCFRKRVSHLVTYSSSNHSTQIDYIRYRKSFRKAVNDVKVIPTEECVKQHNLFICDFSVCIPSAQKRKFTPRIRTWKLRDPAVSKDFQGTFKDKVAALTPVESSDYVEDLWSKLKTPLLETASEVCGLSKKHQCKRETWRWDDKVEDAVKKK